MPHFTTSQIAALTGISIPTLRYYERIGLLDPVPRAANGHRRYTEADRRRLDFLQRLRATGMSIRAMQDYVALFRAGDHTASRRREMLEVHRAIVQAQIDALLDTLALLDTKIEGYRLQEEQQAVAVIGNDQYAG